MAYPTMEKGFGPDDAGTEAVILMVPHEPCRKLNPGQIVRWTTTPLAMTPSQLLSPPLYLVGQTSRFCESVLRNKAA